MAKRVLNSKILTYQILQNINRILLFCYLVLIASSFYTNFLCAQRNLIVWNKKISEREGNCKLRISASLPNPPETSIKARKKSYIAFHSSRENHTFPDHSIRCIRKVLVLTAKEISFVVPCVTVSLSLACSGSGQAPKTLFGPLTAVVSSQCRAEHSLHEECLPT